MDRKALLDVAAALAANMTKLRGIESGFAHRAQAISRSEAAGSS